MLKLLGVPDCVEVPEGGIEIRLCFKGLPDRGILARGVRSASGEHIAQGDVIVPGGCVQLCNTGCSAMEQDVMFVDRKVRSRFD